MLCHRKRARERLQKLKQLRRSIKHKGSGPDKSVFAIVAARALHFHSKEFKLRFGLLYNGYVENREWWEACVLVRKILVVFISAFGVLLNSAFLQAFIALLIVFLSMIAHLTGSPFDRETRRGKLLHSLEFSALTVAFLTFWAGLLFCLADANRDENIISATTLELLSVIVILGNLTFLAISLTILVRESVNECMKKNRVKQTSATTKCEPTSLGTENSSDMKTHQNGNHRLPHLSPNQILPVSSPAQESTNILNHVKSLEKSFQDHERRLKHQHFKRQSQSKMHTQMRVLARAKIRQHKALEKIPMFSHLDPSAIDKLLESTHFKQYKSGDVICRQGDLADTLFLIVSGNCSVSVTSETGVSLQVAMLKELDVFGENALQGDESAVRMATVTARGNQGKAYSSQNVQVLTLDRNVFLELLEVGVIDKNVADSVHELGQRHRRDTKSTILAIMGEASQKPLSEGRNRAANTFIKVNTSESEE